MLRCVTCVLVSFPVKDLYIQEPDRKEKVQTSQDMKARHPQTCYFCLEWRTATAVERM